MSDKLNGLLEQFPVFEKLAADTEELREKIDQLRSDFQGAALSFLNGGTMESIQAENDKAIISILIEVDTNMLKLMNYHMNLSSELLKLWKK
jgi:hypothetical protein